MRHRTLLLLLLLLLLMATTRNAETPPNFVPKTLQNRAQKVPNVPSEIPRKKELLPAFVITVLSRLLSLADSFCSKGTCRRENTMAVVVVVRNK